MTSASISQERMNKKLKTSHDSSFELFMHRASNMSNIWENIMCHLAGTDVANCLKTCKTLRFAIKQCLETSTKFKHQTDVAATASAIHRRKILSSSEFDFSDGRKYTILCSLDNIWYYHRRDQSYIPSLIKLDLPVHTTKARPLSVPNLNIRITSGDLFDVVIHPTLDPGVVLVQDYNNLTPLKLASHSAELVPDVFYRQWVNDGCMALSSRKRLEKRQSTTRTRCIEYRLVAEGHDEGRQDLTMIFYDVGLNKGVELSKFASGRVSIMHLASNEQVPVIIYI